MNKNIYNHIAKGLELIESIESMIKQAKIDDYIKRNEQWCRVSGFPNYAVSTLGRVINTETGTCPTPWRNQLGYAMVRLRCGENETIFALHRLIAFTFIENDDDLPCVDHINNNPYDNRVCNLRWCTHQQNMWNQTKQKDTIAMYKGVSKNGNGWKAHIGHNGKVIYLGYRNTQQECAILYNEKARELFGEFAKLNDI